MPTSGCRARVLSFPLCGNSLLNHWIPACAGMTEGLRSGIRQEWKGGCRDGDKPHSSPVVIPAQAGIQAGGPECEGMAGFAGCPRPVIMPVYCHSRLSRNGLSKPLDSGLRRNDNGGFRRAAMGLLAVSPRPRQRGANFTSAQAGFPCPAAASGYWIGAARSGAPPSRRGLPQRPGLAVSARNRAG